uniref:LIM zinc-binding domain-containing protein n=1 Tax=Meloidogyne incognita TaxID=6306 RepID=A0A914LRK9_MELIC
MNAQNNNSSLLIETSTIQLGTNPTIKKELKREIAKQQCPFLGSEMDNEKDGKQFISKDESDMLRDSILQINRPRINRPPWEIIEHSTIAQPVPNNNKEGSFKKDDEEDSSKTGTTFLVRSSNSSTSGCSSNPQSGSCSPIVFNSGNFTTKTTTRNFTFARENGFENGFNEYPEENKINIPELVGKQQGVEELKRKKEWTFATNEGSSCNGPTKIISASLIQNALLKSGATNSMINTKQPQKLPQSSPTIATTSASSSHSTTSSTSSNSSSYSRSPIYSKNSPLKRKEFSESRRKILQDQKNEEEQLKILEKAKEAMRWQQQRAVDTVEEVSQLGQAALEQMAILEELEFEDFERKTKISDRLCVKNVPSSSYVSLPTSLTTSSASSTRQEYEINNGATARKSLNTGEKDQLNKQSQNHYSPKRQQHPSPHFSPHLSPQNKLEQTTSPSQQFSKQKSPAPILDKNKLFESNNKTNTTTNNKTNTTTINSTTKNSTPTNSATNTTNNKTKTTTNNSAPTNTTTNNKTNTPPINSTTKNTTTINITNSTTNKTNNPATNNKTNTPTINTTTNNSTTTNPTTNTTNNKTNTTTNNKTNTTNTSTRLTTNKNTTNNSTTTTNKTNSTMNKTNSTLNITNNPTTTNKTSTTNNSTTTNKTNSTTNNSTTNIANNPTTTNKTSTNSSQHSLKSLATSIIRYDDETREREQREKQKIKTTTPQTSPGTLFSAQSPSGLLECKTCGKAITNVVLQALGASFHPACFRCQKCSRCLDGIPFTVEQNGEGVICMDDYERYFVTHCRACKKAINAVNEFGKIVRIVVEDREYHIQCYCCEGCGMQLSNETQNKCYPIGEHLLCRRCHTLWRRMGALETDAAVSDL